MADLAHVLRHLPRTDDPNLLLGSDRSDDAAIYRLGNDQALVQTVDFFTPVVDDPYTFGAIAAANSLSDVYAVGGTPITALNIAAFPTQSLPLSILSEILRGGADKAREAGVAVIGGHTVEDAEPKYGMAVTGLVHPDRFLSTRGGREGDILVLTKPLGTGIISTALKAGHARESDVRQAVLWMTTLNAGGSEASLRVDAHAVTDVTGFGLLGHLSDLCAASGVAATVFASSLPLLPNVLGYARQGCIPGGTSTNILALESVLTVPGHLSDEWLHIAMDPQTSGGLLVAIAPDTLSTFADAIGNRGIAQVVGTLHAGRAGAIVLQA